MKQKHIDALREVRLWLRDILIPLAGIMVLSPDARETAAQAFHDVKNSIKRNRK